MTLIEGIGDEVTQFFTLLVIIFVALTAWWSTNISDRPLLRTVLILERRGTRRSTTENHDTIELTDTPEASSDVNESETENKTTHSVSDTNNQLQMNAVDNKFDREASQSTLTGVDDIPRLDYPYEDSEGAGDPDNTEDESSVVRNRRIAFFQNREEPVEDQSQIQPFKNTREECSTSREYEANPSDEGGIRIRLKYLNDELKLVDGRLQEQLGDFKRRHFSLELNGRNLVRLIFNGKILQQDSKTLQNYGFFDNCVVHCVVHQPRTPPPSPNLNRSRRIIVPHWDLGNILFASLSFLLCLAWYGRYQYAQLYTATTTLALIALTGMFTITVIGFYFPDIEGIGID